MDIDTSSGLFITLLVFGRWAVSIGFGTLWVYTCEVIPTSVRHFAFGVNSSLAYLTLFVLSLVGPFLREYFFSPMLIVGIGSLILVKVASKLPET